MSIALIFAGLLAVLMLVVMVLDIRHYIIPNTLNLSLLVLYAFGAYFLQIEWPMALLAAGLMLIVGIAFFSLGLMGGGDIKLLVALTLWTGWDMPTAHLLMLTAILGGCLALVILLARAAVRSKEDLPRVLRPKQPIPYGVAIAVAFLLLLWRGEVPGLEALTAFGALL